MGNKLDISKSLQVNDGFECHGLKYPPSYAAVKAEKQDQRDRRHKNEEEEYRGTQKGVTREDWMQYDYPVDNLVLSGGGSKGYAFVGAFKVRPAIIQKVCDLFGRYTTERWNEQEKNCKWYIGFP